MRKYFTWMLVFGLLLSTSITSESAAVRGGTSPTDELVMLLPDSDIVAVVDLPRATRELLPLLKTIEMGGISKLVTDFEEFSGLAGLDAGKITSAVLGVKMEGLNVRGGVLIVEGLDLDAKAIETAATAKRWKFQTLDQQTRPIYRVERATSTAAPAPAAPSDEIFLASLGLKRVVAGDLASVRSTLNGAPATAAAPKAANNATLRAAVRQTELSSLARFALVLPNDLRRLLEDQGDLFKQLAAVKVIFGTLDMTIEKSAAIKAMLSTNSPQEATQMESSLKSLLALGKSFLGGDQNGQIAQLLDQVQIGTRESDVLLSLIIPKSLLDQLTKTSAPK